MTCQNDYVTGVKRPVTQQVIFGKVVFGKEGKRGTSFSCNEMQTKYIFKGD